jgi:hypothetical protein
MPDAQDLAAAVARLDRQLAQLPNERRISEELDRRKRLSRPIPLLRID